MKSVHASYIIISAYVLATLAPGQLRSQESDVLSLASLLETNIFTAAKYEQDIKEAPASVSIITSLDIERNGYRTLDEALMSVRGLYVSNDRNYSYLGVRGFSRPTDYNNRVLLLLNGHPINEYVYGSALIGSELGLALSDIKRIEIVRGPGSALYGTSAMFGVINIITKTGQDIDGFSASAGVGSYGERSGRARVAKTLGRRASILVSANWAEQDGQDFYFDAFDTPETNYGIAENLDWNKRVGLLSQIKYGDFTIQGSYTSRKKGIPTAPWEFLFNTTAFTVDRTAFAEASYERPLGINKTVKIRGYFDHYHYFGHSAYDTPYFDATDNNWLGTELQLTWDMSANNRIIFGQEFQKHLRADYRAWDEESVYFDGDFPFSSISFYAQDELQLLKNLAFTIGLRIDRRSEFGTSFSPRAALVYHPAGGTTVKLLYGEAYRAPSVFEYNYFEDDYWKVNRNLRSERIRTAEAIVEQEVVDGVFSALSLYSFAMRDLIDPTEDPNDGMYLYENVSKVQAAGIEFETRTVSRKGVNIHFNYAYQSAKDAESDIKLTNSPAHLMKSGAIFPFRNTLFLAVEVFYESARKTVYNTETSAYVLTNVNLSTKLLSDHFRPSLRIGNVLDINYSTPGGFEHLQAAIPQNGRHFHIGLEYQF
jgi:iron complex outermembrane receptor protein